MLALTMVIVTIKGPFTLSDSDAVTVSDSDAKIMEISS